MLLAGVDPSTCHEEFNFGKDGKPLYIRGPNETLLQAHVIATWVREAGGDYIVDIPDPSSSDIFKNSPDDDDEFDPPDELP
jgi:hypothetical protein